MSLPSHRCLIHQLLLGFFLVVKLSHGLSDLHVPIGRFAFIKPSDVTAERHDNVTSCKVKVVVDDVANVLKVGRVEPQAFDCNFKPETVRYVHSGNPLLSEDTIVLVVYQLTDKTTTEQHVRIRVLIEMKQYDVVINQPRQRPLVVSSSSPLSDAIDEDFLRFRYNFVDGATCLLTYADPSSSGLNFPLAGTLVYGSTNETVNNSTMDCREFLRSNIRYIQTDSMVEVDYVPLEIEVENLTSTTAEGETPPIIRERVYLEVRDMDAVGSSNMAPKIIISEAASLRVEQFNSAALNGDVLSAVDRETNFRFLVFNVTRIAFVDSDEDDDNDGDRNDDEVGRLVDVHDLTRPIRSFLQDQLIGRRIAFYPTLTRPLVSDRKIFISLIAIDSHFLNSEEAALTIVVGPNSGPTTAPKIVYGRRLVVNEGGKQPLSASNMIIVGRDNDAYLSATQFHVRGGLRHGSIEVDGVRTTSFTGSDLHRWNAVVYRHDGTDTTDDRIVLRIVGSGGRHAFRVRLPVSILPVHDSAPHLTATVPIEVPRGGYAPLATKNLNASERDISSGGRRQIVYVVARGQPKAGEIVRRMSPLTGGRITNRFTQLDIDRGFIYYRHRGAETPTKDQFEFRLLDEFANRSAKHSLDITILASDNIPPQELIQMDTSSSSSKLNSEGHRLVPRRVLVAETDAVVLSRDMLSYEDVENRTESVIYTITSPPYFVTSSITVDAGQLILLPVDNYRLLLPTSFTNHQGSEYFQRDAVERAMSTASNAPLTTFSQSDVDAGRIVYVPPREDIGPVERHVRFLFAVSDIRGASILDQIFDVIVLPVDNQLPHLSLSTTVTTGDGSHIIEVPEGGSKRFVSGSIVVYDPDTDLGKLVIGVEELPTNGRLMKDGVRMNVGETFHAADLNTSDISYEHSGPVKTPSKFSLSVFDGLHKVINEIAIVIVKPSVSVASASFDENLVSKIEVKEGGEVVLTTENLSASSDALNAYPQITFHVLKSPEFGELRLDSSATSLPLQSGPEPDDDVTRTVPSAGIKHAYVVYRFTQADIARGAVRYVHTGGEIGHETLVDVLTVTVTESDRPLRMHASNPVPLRDIEVTIVPQDNTAPLLVVGGPIRVGPGQRSVTITPDVITARDVDSPDDSLTFVIAQTPMWGFLERSKPLSGSAAARSGRSQTSRRVTSFSLTDLREGTVQYVPSNLARGGGPTSDSFFLYVTDGSNRSPSTQIEVAVASAQAPSESRLPEFTVVDSLAVDEGGETQFDVRLADRTLGRHDIHRESTSSDVVGAGQLVLSVVIAPVHGKLVLVERIDGRVRQTDLREVIITDQSLKVIYRHDGSESREDGFTLNLIDKSNNNAAFRKSVTVTVRAINDEPPILVKNLAASVDFGGTLMIPNSALKATDIDNFADEIFFVITTKPKRGDLEMMLVTNNGMSGTRRNRDIGTDRPVAGPISFTGTWAMIEVGSNFTQQAIDEKRVRYVHTTCLGEAMPMDEFTFVVTDGTRTTPADTFVIDISRSNARRMLVASREMMVRDGETRVVSADLLGADDGAGRPSELSFTVTQSPQHGSLGLAGQSGSPLVSFTQSDLRSQRILYKHVAGGRHQATGAGGGLTKDGFRFTVTSASRPYLGPVVGHFRILIESSERRLPTLDANVPLTVIEGDTSTLTANNLRVSQPGTPSSNLTFIVVERPRRGELLVGGVPVARSFTQADVDSSAVEYRSEAIDDTMTDYFLFAVADGRHDGYLVNGTAHRKPAFFNVLIQPASKDPPKLLHNRSPTTMRILSAGRKGFTIGSEQLNATRAQPGGRASDLWYILKDTCCQHGYLEHAKTARPIRRKFSQMEVDEGNVVYVMNIGDQQRRLAGGVMTNDSFLFRLQDQHNNYVDDLRYLIEWSAITLEKAQYSVCEAARRLDIVIRRHGAVASHVTVNVRVKSLSARQKLDFVENSANLVEFAPGVTRLTWTIDIVEDNLESEPDERFKILLKNPVNAIIGDVSKSVVHVLNSVDGQCPSGPDSRPSNRKLGGNRRIDYDDDDDEEEDDNIDELNGFEEVYDDRGNLFDSFGVDENDETENRFDNDDYGMSSSQFGDIDLLPPPRDEMTQGRLLDDDVWNNDENDDVDDRGWKRGRRRGEQSSNKYRKVTKSDRKSSRTKNTEAWPSKMSNSNRRDKKYRVRLAPTTTTAKPTANAECTADTSGLLYFDMLSSKMYRCSGREWQEWGWGTAGGEGFQYTALLKDAAASSTSPEQSPDVGDDVGGRDETVADDVQEDDDIETTMSATTNDAMVTPRQKSPSQCKAGWSLYETNCYLFHIERKSWAAANQTCADDGGSLTEVKSKTHLTWLWKQLAGQKNFWIGLSDRLQPGVWKYENTQRAAKYFNWRKGFPRPTTSRQSATANAPKRRPTEAPGPRENCVQVGKLAEWVNKPCGPKPKARFVCVVETSTRIPDKTSASSRKEQRKRG